MSEITQPIAEGSKQPVESPVMTEASFLASRIKDKLPPEAPSSNDAPPKKEEVVTESKDVLSKDVDELTDDEISELAQKGKSGLLKRLSELTLKRKLAEEKAAALELALNNIQQRSPEVKVENNPYKGKTPDELKVEATDLDKYIDWAEDILFDNENSSSADVVYNSDGKEYTKSNIRESLRNAKKRRDKFLPAQWSEINKSAHLSTLEQTFKGQARKELGWLDGEDNDVRKRYESMINDPRLKQMKESVPEIAPQLEYLIAHAANSMYSRKSIDVKPKGPTINPPSNPSSSAAQSERSAERSESSNIEERFKRSGSSNDFIALRTAQLSKRL